jgi:hypothetical protein
MYFGRKLSGLHNTWLSFLSKANNNLSHKRCQLLLPVCETNLAYWIRNTMNAFGNKLEWIAKCFLPRSFYFQELNYTIWKSTCTTIRISKFQVCEANLFGNYYYECYCYRQTNIVKGYIWHVEEMKIGFVCKKHRSQHYLCESMWCAVCLQGKRMVVVKLRR